MSELTPRDAGYTCERYFGLVRAGALHPDDRVELLDGVIVAEPPQEPRHASGTTRAYEALRSAVGGRAVVRVQMPFIAGRYSVPEPDVAVVPGAASDYDTAHPSQALLIVEVADSSLPQDRLSKSRIYSGAGVGEYWLVNLRDDCVEIWRDPDVTARAYRDKAVVRRGERIHVAAFADAWIAVDDLLPQRTCR